MVARRTVVDGAADSAARAVVRGPVTAAVTVPAVIATAPAVPRKCRLLISLTGGPSPEMCFPKRTWIDYRRLPGAVSFRAVRDWPLTSLSDNVVKRH
jgi:hypothetical protein